MRQFMLLALTIALMIAITPAPTNPLWAQSAGAEEKRLHNIESKHYDLYYYGTKAEAKEGSLLLETAFQSFGKFFGKTIKLKKNERLSVFVDENEDKMVRRIASAGENRPGAGGLYLPSNKTAYAYIHPNKQGVREILLHEAAHQFHYIAKTNNESKGPTWYREGIAESLCLHHWDGKNLELGVTPLFSRKRSFEKAFKTFSAEGFNVDAFLKEEQKVSYPEWAAFTSWMVRGNKGKNFKKYQKFSKQIEAGGEPRSAFIKNFGKTKKSFPAFLKWLESNQRPWEEKWQEWDALSATCLQGWSDVIGLMTLRHPCEELSFASKSQTPEKSRLGVLLAYEKGKILLVAEIVNDSYLQIRKRDDKGKWSSTRANDMPKAKVDSGFRNWKIDFKKEQAIISIDGSELRRVDLPESGERGLYLDSCHAEFKAIEATFSTKPTKSSKKKK